MNRLKVCRAEKKITQFQLSVDSGIIQSRLSYIENDLVQPRLDEKKRIAKALGCKPEEIWDKNVG